MKDERVIHIKIDYSEGLEAKKDILFLQASLIKFIQSIQRYHFLRSEHLKTREDLKKEITSMKNNVVRINTNLPKVKIPKILQKEYLEETYGKEPVIDIKEKVKKEKHIEKHNTLESELAEIQAKLQRLSA